MPAATIRALALLALVVQVACRSGDASWAQYEGQVASDRSPDSPATARLTVAQTGDTAFSGYLNIDPRHAGTGDVWGWYPADSVHFVSVSTAGDTVFWRAERSARTVERLAGRYEITGGERAGQGGRWSATLERGVALRAGGPDLGALRKSVSRIPWLVLWLGFLGLGLSVRWALRPASHVHIDSDTLSPVDAELQGVGGWMAWFLFGQAVTIVWSIVRLPSNFGAFQDGTWEMGDVIPSLQPMLVLESLFSFVQIAGPALGLYLTFRHDLRAPRFWFVYICATLIYSVVEVGGWEHFQWELARAFGQSAADEVSREVAHDMRRTSGGIGWAPIWMAYWSISKRVRFTFGRGALGAPPPYSTASLVPRTVSQPARSSVETDSASPISTSSDTFRIPPTSTLGARRACPHCAELVLAQANSCKHCRRDLEPLA